MNDFQIYFFIFIIFYSSVKSEWFPKFGRLVEVPLKSHGKMKWHEAVIRCHDIGGRPFIPKDKKEFMWMEMHHTEAGFNTVGGATMWFPASDRALEGRLIFTDGKGTETHGDAMLWRNDVVMQQNSDLYDCVGYRTDNAAYMYDCDVLRYPMICEKDVDVTTANPSKVIQEYEPSRTDCIPLNSSSILSSLNGDPITLFAPSNIATRYTGVINVYYGPTWQTVRTLPVDLSRHAVFYSNGIMMLAITPRFKIRLAHTSGNIYTFYLTTNQSEFDRFDDFAYTVSEKELLLKLSDMGDSIWYQNCYPVGTTTDGSTEQVTASDDLVTDNAANTLSKHISKKIIIGITAFLLLVAIAVVVFFWRRNSQNKDGESGNSMNDRNMTYHNLKDENITFED